MARIAFRFALRSGFVTVRHLHVPGAGRLGRRADASRRRHIRDVDRDRLSSFRERDALAAIVGFAVTAREEVGLLHVGVAFLQTLHPASLVQVEVTTAAR